MRPVIAVAYMADDLTCNHLRKHYEQALLRAGAEVCWLEPENLEEAVKRALDCHGLLLPGGPDVNPGLYGQERSEKCGKPNPARDTLETELLKAFLPTGKPVFGVCRGIQILNVFCGGTLHQDIAHIQKCRHRDRLCCRSAAHGCSVEEGSLLYSIVGEEQLPVNSLHHQAVDRLGEGLAVCAVSADGIPEAAELPGHPFCLAVQWHPEMLAERHPVQQKLFDAFVAACIPDVARV